LKNYIPSKYNHFFKTEENINLLAKGRVDHVQITLDGPMQFHNKRRVLINGGGTYDVILKNLYRLTQMLPDIGITIRMNVSRGTTKWQQWEQLLTDIAPIKDSVSIYFDRVTPTRFSDKFCISHESFYPFNKGSWRCFSNRDSELLMIVAHPALLLWCNSC